MKSITINRNGDFLDMEDGQELRKAVMSKQQLNIFLGGLSMQSGRNGIIPWNYLDVPVYIEAGYELTGKVIRRRN